MSANSTRVTGHVLLFLCLVGALARGRPAQAMSFTVNSTADAVDASLGDGVCATAAGECTLRAAIQEANAMPGQDEIILPAGIYTLTIAGADENQAGTGDLDITDGLTLTGAGAASTTINGLSGPSRDRVFHITPAQAMVTIQDLTISRGSYAGNGGGLYNNGVLTINNSVFSNNRSRGPNVSGGAIYNNPNGTLTVNNSTFTRNWAVGTPGSFYRYGGAITNRGR